MAAADALAAAGIEPLVLQAKEGLALLNGTQMMSGIGALSPPTRIGSAAPRA